jgi:hypothetical protein
MNSNDTTAKTFGLIDKADGKDAHQLQLWLTKGANGVSWEVRNAFMPGGKVTKSCQLDSGFHPDENEARRLGQASFDRNKS